MLTWQVVVWAYSFVGATHEWVVSRFGDAWGAMASAVAYLAQAGLGIQILVAVAYIAIGVWFGFQAEPAGARAVVWYDRVFIALLWLPAFAFGLGLMVAVMAYGVGVAVAFYAGAAGLVLLPWEAVVRGAVSLALR